MTKAATERQEAIDKLRGWVKPGDTVYTIVRHVSRSGMSRVIGVVLLEKDGPTHPNWWVAKAVGIRQHPRLDGVVVGGSGMDMGFHLVKKLSARLYPAGFGCIGQGCPSNDHSNGDRDYTTHSPEGTRIVTYERRTNGPGELATGGRLWGRWGQEDIWGKRVFYHATNESPTLYLFHDEVISDEPAAQHWHRDGGYALRQRLL